MFSGAALADTQTSPASPEEIGCLVSRLRPRFGYQEGEPTSAAWGRRAIARGEIAPTVSS